MHLNKLTIRVEASLLIKRRLRRTRADHRVRRLAEDCAYAAGTNDDRVGRKRADFHGPQIHGTHTTASAVAIKHSRQKLPMLVLLNLALALVPADLLIKRVEELLSGCRAGKGRTVVQGSTEAAEVEQALRSAVERNAHAVEQVDNARGGFAHGLDGRLVGKEITAVNGIVKVFPGRVAFAFQILSCVNSALRTHRVRPLYRDNRKQVDVAAHFGDLDNCRESR